MLIQSSDRDVNIDYYALATLKHLASNGAMQREVKLSSTTLAADLDISGQTASRRLQTLEKAGLIYRQPVSDGQNVFIRDAGKEVLWGEYRAYLDIFDSEQDLTLTGTIVDGLGEGSHFVSLPGYLDQFVEKLGYEPYPGTLNVDLTPNAVRTRRRLTDVEPIHINGWEDADATYGPVDCYPAMFEMADRVYRPVHAVVPARTDHETDQLELIAPVELREKFSIRGSHDVRIRIKRPW